MKKVAILLAEGFEESEALVTLDVLRRAQIEANLVSIKDEYVKGSHGVVVKSDEIISEKTENYDMIVLPGGLPGATNLADNEMVIKLVQNFNGNNEKFVAAICASPAIVLSRAGIEKDRYITSYPGEEFENLLENANYVEELVVVDKNLITSRGPATTMLFAYKLVDVLGGNSKDLKEGMLWNMLENEEN